MIVTLIDNGSLEPAAHRNLRAVAAALAERTGIAVAAVSWKHSDRIPAVALDGVPAQTLGPWVRAQLARNERDFTFVPFFISAQGAVGSALRRELEQLQRDAGDFNFTFTDGLAARGVLASIVVDRIRGTLFTGGLSRPPVIVVDHGGPSSAAAALRDEIAGEIRTALTGEIGPLTAASMEGAHGPLLSDVLKTPDFDRGDVVLAPLFLSPGRHAGAGGDLAQIAHAAEERQFTLRCHFTELVGTHPRAVDALALALRETPAAAPTPAPA
jgi:sirohydrochlorin ferrochelatase